MKNILCILFTYLLLSTSCKKKSVESVPTSYFRYVSVDYASLFYLDSKINTNGDSIIFNPDGTIYGQKGKTLDKYGTPTITYPTGGWNDNTNLNNPGVYGYAGDPNERVLGFSYFPNPTHRVELAPIIGGINYLRWASLAAGSHELTLKTTIPTFVNGVQIDAQKANLFSAPYTLEPGAVQTVFLINKSQAKTALGKFPYYVTDVTPDFYSSQPDIVSLKDNPENLKFNDSSAYIRFLNFTPSYPDPSFNQRTENVDVYLSPLRDSTEQGVEQLAGAKLKRFESAANTPFLEIPLNPWLRGDTAGRSQYYKISVYSSGESGAKGNIPLGSSLIPIFNAYSYVAKVNNNDQLFSGVNAWLMRSDGAGFFPTVNTLAIGISNNVGTNNPLLLRSCIAYQRAGIGRRYFQ